MIDLGYQLRYIRKKMDVSQRALAEKAGVHANTIMAFENGKHVPSADTVADLFEALGYELGVQRMTAR